MTSAEDEFVRLLRAEPDSPHQRLARRCGLSGRAARRLVAQHDRDRLASSVRARRVLVVALALGVAATAAWNLDGRSEPSARKAAPTTRDAGVVQAEHDLYSAIDRQDAAKVSEAVEGLSSDDEGLRLASLRYLATVRAVEHTPALLRLFDDPSERLRPAALQLVGGFPGQEVESKLVLVSLDHARPIAERNQALTALSSRPPSDSRALARSLLPGLLDPSQPLRQQVGSTLTLLTGQRPGGEVSEPARLHEEWRRIVGVVD